MGNFTYFPEHLAKIDLNLKKESLKVSDIVVGKGLSIENGMLKVLLSPGLVGFVPLEEITITKSKQDEFSTPHEAQFLIDRTIFMMVDEVGENIILSRKKSMELVKSHLINNIGTNLHAYITNVRPKVAFLDLGHGVVGILKICDSTVAKIRDLSEIFEKDFLMEVKIKEFCQEYNSFLVSYREAFCDYSTSCQAYVPGNVYPVTICEPTDGGYFVSVAANIAGFLDTTQNLEYGTKTYAYLKKIGSKGFKFVLSGIY